jgi:hypothetical protein
MNLSFWCHLTDLNQSVDFWCDLSNHSANNYFLYYIKFLCFAPLYWVLLNIGGLLQGPPKDFTDTNAYDGWNTSNALLLVSFVSKGENQETLYRATRETQQVLEEYNVNYMIEVVSDTKIAKKKRIRKTQRPVYYYDVPSGYQTKTKVKFKARGLQYLLEQRTNRLSAQKEQDINDVWVLHFDEESILTQQAVKGIEKFINKHNIQNSGGAIGQGEILYNSYNYGKKNWLVTAADALRTGDDLGRFRFQYNILHKPISGVHGSFLLVPAVIEQEIGWDLGTSGAFEK